MGETANITMRYQPLSGGDAESRWIRIEQERPEDEALTLDEAAEIIDSLYDIQPCNEGLSGGGEEAEQEPPDEDKLDAAMREALRKSGICKQAEYWIATVRVMRSHPQPGYVLRSETAEVETTTPVTESHRQFVEVNGASIELDMPYAGGLTGIPAGIGWQARGSTINLDRPVRGNLVLRYNTYYERVTLRVPVKGGDGLSVTAGFLAAAGGGGGGASREELPRAAVVAFWGDMAASCDLEPPEVDDQISQSELDEICSREEPGGGGGGVDFGGDCYRSVLHYDRCNCSRAAVDQYTTVEPADCGGAASGTVVRSTKQFHGWVSCEGEEDEINDPDYYYRRCCKPPPGNSLPRCRTSYGDYSGGAEITGGVDHYRLMYGEGVTLIAVLPEGGKCGETITTWETPQKDCCDEVKPLVPREDNPEYITAPGMVVMCVEGGRLPMSWQVSAGYQLDNERNYKEDGGGCERIYATEDACNDCTIRVDDGCSTATMRLSRDNPAEEMEMYPDQTTISPGSGVNLSVINAQGEVQWTPGALKMTTPQGLHHASFVSDDDFCGSTQVTATDACGNTAHATVLSTRGRWVEKFDFDPCSAPWGGAAPAANGWVDNYHGWRAQVIINGAYWTYPAPGGGCDQAWEDGAGWIDPRNTCGYNGVELVTNLDGTTAMEVNCDDPRINVCMGRMCWTSRDKYPGAYYPWKAYSHWISRLFKWECD